MHARRDKDEETDAPPVYAIAFGTEREMTMDTYVGIDVSKRHLDVALLPGDVTFRVANDAAGWATIVTRVRAGGTPACLVVEATNTYHVGLTLALAEADLPAAVMNPQRTAAFKSWTGRRAKTDRHDARALAAFAQQQRPAPTPVPSATVRILKELLACRDGLPQTLVATKNRLQTATDVTRAVHERLLAALETERTQLETEIAAQIAADAVLAGRRALLLTVPGIGPVLSATLAAGLPELGLLEARPLAALAGLAPHPRDSGGTRGQRWCVGGRRHIATALYQMAVTAVRCDPIMGAHYRQLRARRPPKVALVAVARRMLGILNAMIRDGLTWQQTKVGQGQFLAEAA